MKIFGCGSLFSQEDLSLKKKEEGTRISCLLVGSFLQGQHAAAAAEGRRYGMKKMLAPRLH